MSALIMTIIMLVPITYASAAHVPNGYGREVMPDELKKNFDEQKFEAAKFKSATAAERATMSLSLLKDKKLWLSKTTQDLKNILGETSGFFITKLYPTYIVRDATSDKSPVWQIVFLLDSDYLITDAFVHEQIKIPSAPNKATTHNPQGN